MDDEFAWVSNELLSQSINYFCINFQNH